MDMGGSVSKISQKVLILKLGAYLPYMQQIHVSFLRGFAGLFVPMDSGLHFLRLHGPGAVARGCCGHIPLAMAPERGSYW